MTNSNSSRKGRKQNGKTKKVKISKKCSQKGMVESKNCQPAHDHTRGQEPQQAPQYQGWKVGMSAVLHFSRDPECDFCYICGDNHGEFYCPFNYLDGLDDLRTCKERCPPGEHLVVSLRHRQFLQCFVRVSNLPPNFRQWDLGNLCRAFGPMRMWHVPLLSSQICRGVGFAVFKNREDAEAAIEKLNGECFGGHSMRFDWAYPYI